MRLAGACAALIVLGLTAYMVLGGADFGGGFWDLTAGGAERGARVRAMVQRSMGPVWEANHVWLIFVLVVFWTAFPVAFGSVFSTLYVPLFLAAAGIILRGTAFALRGQAATIGEARVLGGAFALSSILTPFCLGAAVGAVASGRVPVGNAIGPPLRSWLTPTSAVTGALAVLTGAYLAAVYLSHDAVRAGLPDLAAAFRARGLVAGLAAGTVAVGGIFVLRSDARDLFDGLTRGAGLACVLASAAAGAGTLGLLWRRHLTAARVSAAAAVAAIALGWALAQQPLLLPPRLTVDGAAAGHATLVALLASIGVGLAVIGPALVLLYRMALAGRLEEDVEVLEQRFRPLETSDHR
jgi:cytochrome bd ubiquinol oxidase subunit II